MSVAWTYDGASPATISATFTPASPTDTFVVQMPTEGGVEGAGGGPYPGLGPQVITLACVNPALQPSDACQGMWNGSLGSFELAAILDYAIFVTGTPGPLVPDFDVSYDGDVTVTVTVHNSDPAYDYTNACSDPDSTAVTAQGNGGNLILTVNTIGGLAPGDPFFCTLYLCLHGDPVVFCAQTNSITFNFGNVPPPPPGPAPFYQGYPWRTVVTDLQGATITFLDRHATQRTVTFSLDQPAVATGVADADDPEINILHTDGDPFLSYNNRLLYLFRREGGENPWVVRFGGILMIPEDEAASDAPVTHYTAYDPWQYLMSRPLLTNEGLLPGENGITYYNARGNAIAERLLLNTVYANGPCYIDMPGSFGFSGTVEDTDYLTINFQPGTSVGEAWQQLCDTGSMDIVLSPVYDPIGKPGIVAALNVFNRAGSTKNEAIFAWDKPSRSLVGIDRLLDGTKMANVVQFYAGQGGLPVHKKTDEPSVEKYGQWWTQQFIVEPSQRFAVETLAIAQMKLHSRGDRTITIDPAPERSPIPLIDYGLGDRIPVYASKRLRQTLNPVQSGSVWTEESLQRIYTIPIVLDDDGVERVQQLLLGQQNAPPTVPLSLGTSALSVTSVAIETASSPARARRAESFFTSDPKSRFFTGG